MSDFGNNLLELHLGFEQHIAHQIWLGSVPKIPSDSLFWRNLQATAVQTAGVQHIQGYLNNVRSPNDTSIKYLDLSHKNLYYLPRNIGNYRSLTYLSAKHNRLQAISPKLAQCKHLRKLDISSNQLYNIPFNLIYLSQIQELNLSDNRLSVLPSYFYNLSDLKVLDLSNTHPKMAVGYNNFANFPLVLIQMPWIEKLFLEKLPLKTMPFNINEMKGLKVLSLKGNTQLDLKQAIDVIARLPNLIALDVSFLGRTSLPKNISKLKNLRVLVWHEQSNINQSFAENDLRQLVPQAKVFHGASKGTPFLRGNSIETIRKAGY